MSAPQYSDESMRAYAALYQPYNDIDIYVEDRSLIGLYERVFSALLDGLARVTAVIPLAGKPEVVAEARRLADDKTRKRFFLVDGDFEWVKRKRRIPNLYQLKCYCFENMAWEHPALIATAWHLRPDLDKKTISATFPLEHLQEFEKHVLPLYISYATCMKLEATCQTVSYSLARLMSADMTRICPDKIRARIKMVHRHLINFHGASATRNARRSVLSEIDSINARDARIVSGKDALIQYAMLQFERRFSYRGNRNQLVSLLMSHSTFSVDKGLRRAIRRAAR